MNRADLQKLSNMRIREAKLLFAAGEYSGAYYLAGYAVECGLKACIAKGVKKHDFPPQNVRDIYSHNLTDLVSSAGMKNELSHARKVSVRFDSGWAQVAKWKAEDRYAIWTKNDAEAMIDAIIRRRDGVLPWIKQRW